MYIVNNNLYSLNGYLTRTSHQQLLKKKYFARDENLTASSFSCIQSRIKVEDAGDGDFDDWKEGKVKICEYHMVEVVKNMDSFFSFRSAATKRGLKCFHQRNNHINDLQWYKIAIISSSVLKGD